MNRTLTARTPDDLLALVPVVLGFVPQDSVVMLTFGARRTFHARVDLPQAKAPVADMVESLLEPACRHGVPRVVFVVYTDDALLAERVSRRLVRAFREEGIEVVDLLRADGRRWFPMLRHRSWAPASGVPYDVTAHPFAAQSVVDGQVTHRSRADLAASLEPVPERVAAVEAAVGAVEGAPDPGWVGATVLRHAAAGTFPADDEAARLLWAISADIDARDAAWIGLSRAHAEHQVALWTDLLCRAPGELCAAPAAVLAMAAWFAGHGALAWCAVDRADEAAPGHTLARLVGDLLAAAVPPSAWEEVFSMRDPA